MVQGLMKKQAFFIVYFDFDVLGRVNIWSYIKVASKTKKKILKTVFKQRMEAYEYDHPDLLARSHESHLKPVIFFWGGGNGVIISKFYSTDCILILY